MKILITGACGYLGTVFLDYINKKISTNKLYKNYTVLATDIKQPTVQFEGIQYRYADIQKPHILNAIFEEYLPQVVVHLAAVVNPPRHLHRAQLHAIEVQGTENVLQACVQNKVQRIIVTSSGAAYGYHATNPTPIPETHALQGNYEFAYSYHKHLVEQLLEKYSLNYPNLKQVIFRVGTILGKNTQNQITDLFNKKVILGIKNCDSPFVFINDTDMAACLWQAIDSPKTGIYNVAGNGMLTMRQIATILQKRYVELPEYLIINALRILKKMKLSQYGAEQIGFLKYRPVLDNTKLKNEFGFVPTYSSEEAFRLFAQK